MILQIEAIDTLFFRDGKPFEMGDENWANGIFPPLPSAFYGAIRTAYFSQYPEKLQSWEAGEIKDPTEGLRIRGIYLLKGTIPQFVIPTEIVEKEIKIDDMKKNKVFYHTNICLEEVFSSNPLQLNTYTEEVEAPKAFLKRGDLENYLKDTFGETDAYFSLESYISKESKIGIGRQNTTRTTEEGKLYRVQLSRPELAERVNSEVRRTKTNLLIDINLENLGANFLPNFIKLGGENKLARCTKYSREVTLQKPPLSNKFKIYLQTPAIFKKTEIDRQEGGWLPDCFVYDAQAKAYIGTWKGVKLKLLRAFVSGSVSVGGFDVKAKQPKTMYRAVPAGTVYHFEILDNTNSETIYTTFANPDAPLSDILPEQGFGLSLVGLLNN